MKTTIDQVKDIVTLFLKENNYGYAEFKLTLNADKTDVSGGVYTEDLIEFIDDDDDETLRNLGL